VSDVTVTAGRPPIASRSIAARWGCETSDLLVAGFGLLLAVVYGPPMSYPTWTPRAALVLAALPIGLLLLGRGVVGRSRPTTVAAVFAVWTVISALLSGAVRSALLGFVGRDHSAVIIVGSLAIWAIGASVSARGAEIVAYALLGGLTASAGVGALQVILDVNSGLFALNGGRPGGFTSNPVYFGGLCALGTILGAALASDRRSPSLMIAGAVSGAGVMLSGSRVALGAVVVGSLALAAWRGRRALVPLVAAGAGHVVGYLVNASIGGSSTGVDRAVSEGGFDGRWETWGYALRAFAERPITGWGFGRFRSGVQGHYTPEFVASYARRDIGVAWFDAHNIVLAVLVAAGAVGLVLAAWWFVEAVRGTAGPVLLAVMVLFVTWMLQPAGLATLPIGMLLFGVARRWPADAVSGPVDDDRDSGVDGDRAEDVDADAPVGGAGTRAAALALALGGVMAVGLVAADMNFYDATEALDAERSESAAAFFPGDPVVASVVAQVWAIETEDPVHPKSIDWWRQAAERDPDRPYWWAQLAFRQMLAGDTEAARTSLDRAFAVQPYHFLSTKYEVRLAVQTEDEELLRESLARACEIDAPECAADIDEVLATFDGE
jgi:O-antigen ligase